MVQSIQHFQAKESLARRDIADDIRTGWCCEVEKVEEEDDSDDGRDVLECSHSTFYV